MFARRRMLAVPLAVSLMCAPSAMVAQAKLAVSEAPDKRIAAALRDVSTARIQATIEKLASFGTRHTLSATPEATAKGRGIGVAREWIRAEFERYSKACGGCLDVQMQSFIQQPADRVPQPTEIVNVYAVLKGTNPEAAKRIYIVTGHYDSRASDPLDAQSDAPGANDDASGTAVSLEAARVLSQQKFPATIIFMAVAGEEQGLNGARYFAKWAKEQGMNIAGVLNNDIVGGNKSKEQDPSIVRVFSEGLPIAATEADLRLIRATGGESDSPSRQLARYIREIGKLYLPQGFGPKMVFRRDRYLRGGDHTAFNESGFAAVRFTEYREDYNRQHQNVRKEGGVEYGDLPKFVDYQYVANVARLNIATLAALASAPAPPGNVKLLTKELENVSQLTWEAAPDAARYEILWRPTTAPEWENVIDAGKGTSYTVPRSKDNVIFGVRSVSARGHRSLPVVPTPER